MVANTENSGVTKEKFTNFVWKVVQRVFIEKEIFELDLKEWIKEIQVDDGEDISRRGTLTQQEFKDCIICYC